MRQIVLDTETTGFSHAHGDRFVEIGCIELINGEVSPNSTTFHHYINPGRVVPQQASAIHGLDNEFLDDKPFFEEIAESMLDFLGDAELIMHNASFDSRFINQALEAMGYHPLTNQITCTMKMSRKLLPLKSHKLDVVAEYFGVSSKEDRGLHGALKDAMITSAVYSELMALSHTYKP